MARGNAMAVLRKNVQEHEAAVLVAADSWLPDTVPAGSPAEALAQAVLGLRAARKLLRQAEGE